MHSHWKCIYLVQSFNCTVLIVPNTRQCMYTFYCLGNMLSLCAEKFFVFFMLRDNVMNCFAPNPLPLNIIWSSSVNKSNYECPPFLPHLLIWPLQCPHVLFLISLENLCPQLSTLLLVWIFSEIAHSPSPWASYQSSAELGNKGFG